MKKTISDSKVLITEQKDGIMFIHRNSTQNNIIENNKHFKTTDIKMRNKKLKCQKIKNKKIKNPICNFKMIGQNFL